MTKKIFLFLLLIASCKKINNRNDMLKMQEIFDNNNKISNVFFLNKEMQKDSIEKIYTLGKLSKMIFWNKGVIDSIANYNRDGLFSGHQVIKDSVSYLYNTNEKMIMKSFINKNGRYQGMAIKYSDTLVSNVTKYSNGKENGLVIHLDENEYPLLIGDLKNDSFHFGIQFYESGSVKSLRVNDGESGFGIIYNYYKNGKIKNKVELKNSKIDGVKYEFDELGNILSKNTYKMGNLENR